MIDITHKSNTLRKAIAQAMISVSSAETIEAVKQKWVAKGDVFEMAKTAGLFAVKKTSDVIPDCHPMPIEFTAVRFEINGLEIRVEVEVHAIYKTGVEVEAMHAASVVALTVYDMLKPIDKNIEIKSIKLIEKKGGKSDYANKTNATLRAAVIVCSDAVSKGKKEDNAGKVVVEKLKKMGFSISDYKIIPDEADQMQHHVKSYCDAKCDIIIITGGTGLSKRDVTPETLNPLFDREIPGIAEAIRSYGQQRTPYSMLSRGVAGMIGDTLVLALPGSTKGAEESMDAVFPSILHIFKVKEGK